MANTEVIDLLDSDAEDDIQVIYESNNESRSGSWPTDSRINHSSNVDCYSVDDDDDDDEVEIVEERINVPERPSPSYVIHSPNGPIPVYENNQGPNEPERRSFQNASGPAPVQNFRNPQQLSDRAIRMRRQEQIRTHNNIQARQGGTSPRPPPSHFIRQQPQPLVQHPMLRRRSRRGVPNASTPLLHMMLHMGNYPMAFNNLFFNDNDDEEDDPNFYPGMMFPGESHDHASVDQHIMGIIEQRENQEADKKRSINENATKQYQKISEDKIANIKAPFTTTIDPEEDYVCILCGVTLGEGISDDFRGNVIHSKLEQLQEENDVRAPYQALNLVTDADRDLSKRIFMSTCGHTYCGRCVKNISNVKSILKEKKVKFKRTDNNIDNPFVYAPSKCIALNCGIGLGARRRFNEIFV